MRRLVILATGLLALGEFCPAQAQTDTTAAHAAGARTTATPKPDSAWGHIGSFEVNPIFIQAHSRIYWDLGQDDPGEIDIFDDGKLSIGLSLLGFEISHSLFGGRAAYGSSLSLGISSTSGSKSTAAALIADLSAFINFNDLFRYEIGMTEGISAAEGLTGSQATDGGVFFGIGFQTSIGKKLRSIVSKPEHE